MSRFTSGFHFLTSKTGIEILPTYLHRGFESPMDMNKVYHQGSQFVGAGLAGGPGLKLAGGVAKFLPIYPGVAHP